ncbi:hypothetical protein ACFL96_04125 [Thermoproteota archaeon]
MESTYITSFKEGQANLKILAGHFEHEYLGEYQGAIAMLPKLVLKPKHRDLWKFWKFETVDELLFLLKDRVMYVTNISGQDVKTAAHDLRNDLGMDILSNTRVHVSKSPAEKDIIEFAKNNGSYQVADYILQNYTMDDLV